MIINKENYQAFLLDLSEGTLSEKETQALYAFINKHPELDGELLSHVAVTPSDGVIFPDKEGLLYEEINEKNRSYFYISSIENQLTKDDEQALSHFIKSNPLYQKEFGQYKKTILPKEEVTYSNKKELLGYATPVSSLNFPVLNIAKIAAVFLLFIGAYSIYKNTHDSQIIQITKTDDFDTKSSTKTPEKLKNDIQKEDNQLLATNELKNEVSTPVFNSSNELAIKNKEPESVLEVEEKKDYLQEIEIDLLTENDVAQKERVSNNLTAVVNSLTPKSNEVLPKEEDKQIIKEPLSTKEFLFAQANKKLPIIAKLNNDLISLKNKVTLEFSENQYISKHDGESVKTQISIGSFSFYRSHSK